MKKKKHRMSNFSWPEYIFVLISLGILGTLPALFYGDGVVMRESKPYIVWYILYWAIVTAIFCGYTAFRKYETFDKPMRKLSEAAEAVSGGDFSVYLEPIHTLDKRNYVDMMFEDFNKMVEELGSIETLKNDFISNVSHEIKTPLSIIQNYAVALKKKDLSDQQRDEYTDTIINASNKLTTLVTNILKLSKLENQEILTNVTEYDLCRQLCDCILDFDMVIEQKGIELVVDIQDKTMMLADEGMLLIVWHNLLSNAIKFTDFGGKITLVQYIEGNDVLVSVSDTGVGIDEKTINRIFDKFYQGDTSHSSEGNGLGLALTHRVVELLGGFITVKSSIAVGTTFIVRLPLK